MLSKNLKPDYISHSRPYLGKNEIDRVAEVIGSGHIVQGDAVRKFEEAFSSDVCPGYAAAVNSGTSALHLALLAIGVNPGDEVIIPSFVCSALLHAVRYSGAHPVVADIDPETFNIDPKDVKRRITSNTRAIIVPHMFGLPANLDRLLSFDIPVVEDCAQSVGGEYQGRRVGSFGVASIFSFYATKVMTTAEGGMVCSGSKELIDRIRDLREYDNKEDDQQRFNYKMSDVHAAIGIAQVDRLSGFIKKRREIAEKYTQAFKSFDFQLPVMDENHIFFRYIIKLNQSASLEKWITGIKDKGVKCERPVFKPIHKITGSAGYHHSDDLWNRLLSIPIYPSLNQNGVNTVIMAITETNSELAGE
jgi:perosamine synthetase